jgi:hypothetical protein
MGIAQENMKKLDEAKAAYKQSVAIDATNTDSLFRLGAIAQAAGDKVVMHDINVAISNIDKNLAQEYSHMLGCELEC